MSQPNVSFNQQEAVDLLGQVDRDDSDQRSARWQCDFLRNFGKLQQAPLEMRSAGRVLLAVLRDALIDHNIILASSESNLALEQKRRVVAEVFSTVEIAKISELPVEQWGSKQMDRLVSRNIKRNYLLWFDGVDELVARSLLSDVFNQDFINAHLTVQPFEWCDATMGLLAAILLDSMDVVNNAETPIDVQNDIFDWVFCEPIERDMPYSFQNCISRLPAKYDVGEIMHLMDQQRNLVINRSTRFREKKSGQMLLF